LKDEVGHSVRTDAVVSISGNREVVPLLDDFESRNFELLHVRAVSNADFKANFVMTSIRTPFSVNNSSNIRMPNVQATVQPTSSSWTDGNHVDALYNTHVLRSFGAFSVLLRCFARLCDLEASGIELPAAEQTLWINVFQVE
jgi:hypothetical protein